MSEPFFCCPWRGLPFSAGLLVRIGLSFLIASVAMSVVFYLFPDLVVWRGVMAYAMLFTLVAPSGYGRIDGNNAGTAWK